MAAMLRTQPGFSRRNITVLTDADATKANVMSKLTDIIGKAKAGKLDHVVFSFSSHGTQVPDQNGDETVDHVDEAFALLRHRPEGRRLGPRHRHHRRRAPRAAV